MEEGEFCGRNSKDRAEKSRRATLGPCSEEGSPHIRKGLSAHTGKGDFIPNEFQGVLGWTPRPFKCYVRTLQPTNIQ